MTPAIAVVVPNHNDSKYLKACLDSVFEQEDAPEQVIIVDDVSTDNSLEIINACIRDKPTAELVAGTERLGTMGALNEGFRHVNTDYVLFLSANDYLRPGIFSHARSRITADGYPGVWSAMVSRMDGKGRISYVYPSPVISLRDVFLAPRECTRLSRETGHWFTGTTLLYRCDCLREIGGFDPLYKGLADMIAALIIASREGASFTPKPFGVMRDHGGGLMTSTSADLAGLEAILQRMSEKCPEMAPALFDDDYCDVMRRRIRFTALRAFEDDSWLQFTDRWEGLRYRILKKIAPLFRRFRKLQLTAAFMLLRPPTDILAILRYRLFGSMAVLVRDRISGLS